MYIPTDIPQRINPALQDPLAHSIVYSFPNDLATRTNDGSYLFRFPYSRDTFWTNFRYSLYGVDNAELDVGIELITTNNFTYDILPLQPKQGSQWHDTVWPLPSSNGSPDSGVFYIRVRPSSVFQLQHFRLHLLGFMDLFPRVQNYLLLTERDTYQFVFYMNDGQDGRVYNVENQVYIQDIVNNAQGIRPISRY